MLRLSIAMLPCFALFLCSCSSSSTTATPSSGTPAASSIAEPSGDAVKPGNAGKIVGIWSAPGGEGTVEFTADGKLKMSFGGISMDGTYSVAGDKLTMTMINPMNKKESKSETMTIKSLTDKEFVTVEPNGKEEKFTRK